MEKELPLKMDKLNKVALITGVTGQDGSYLTEFLLNKGYVVLIHQELTTFMRTLIMKMQNSFFIMVTLLIVQI